MGSLQWILSRRRTQLDLLFKLQSDSNRKKEQVKECRLEHHSSKSGLQARASLPIATDLWQHSDRNWKHYIFMLDLMINLNFMAVLEHGPSNIWWQTEHLHQRTCPWDVYSEHPGRDHLPQGAHFTSPGVRHTDVIYTLISCIKEGSSSLLGYACEKCTTLI